MKPEKQKEIQDIVSAINVKLGIDEKNEQRQKLEKQIKQIAKELVEDIHEILKMKTSKEEKLLAKEVKRQAKANRVSAARAILMGKSFDNIYVP